MNITQLELFTGDIQATIAFYERIPGLLQFEQTTTSVTFKAGNTRLVFSHHSSLRPVYHIAFTIASNKLEAAMAAVSDQLPLLETMEGSTLADFPNWNAASFYFMDNNDNILEYIARYSLDNAATGPFTAADVCNISEVGLVTEDVPALATYIQQTYDLPVYARQPPATHFTALGDDEGLLILAARNRNWYPTSLPAEIYPLNISFIDKDSVQQQIKYGANML